LDARKQNCKASSWNTRKYQFFQNDFTVVPFQLIEILLPTPLPHHLVLLLKAQITCTAAPIDYPEQGKPSLKLELL
jgi:hypothetical protein